MAPSASDSAVLDWLVESDPALRWQVERDLLDAPEPDWSHTRARVAREGWGAALLARQDEDGQWAGGAYFPAGPHRDPADAEPGAQPWIATSWTLSALREWGVDAAVLGDTGERLRRNSRWEYDDLPYWDGEVDVCINAATLANGAWLGVDVSSLAAWFIEHQLDDGGWNCDWVEGATRSSFHSTLNALRGILAYERTTGGSPELRRARRAGEGYLLERQLMYRRGTREVLGPWVGLFAYPFRWQYSALRAVDHLREASIFDGDAPDERAADAVALIRAQRQADGTWLQGHRYRGRVWVDVDAPVGRPSKWVTFFAMRALRWWDEGR